MEPKSKPTLSNDLKILLESVPAPVREFLTGPERDRVIPSMARKYQLHVDQAGALEKDLLLMLLGVKSPEDFLITLVESGVSDDVVGKILTDVNDSILKPLQAKMRVAMQEQKSFAPLKQQQRHPGSPEAAGVPQQIRLVSPTRVLSDHEEPHINIKVATPAVPKVVAPPPNLPGTMQPPIVIRPPTPTPPKPPPQPPAPPRPMPVTPPTPRFVPPVQQTPPLGAPQSGAPGDRSAPQSGLAKPIVKEYGVDPYRETVEEESEE